MYFIGFDLGSSSVKAALIESSSGTVVGLTNYPEREMSIMAKEVGWAEQDPETWWQNCCKVTAKLLAQTGVSKNDIEGIGIAYQMHGMVIVDDQQKVLRPSIIWCDSRAVRIGNQVFIGAGEAKCVEHLLNSPGNFTLSKLKWVKENEPELYRKVYKLLLPGDYIAMRLTGEATTTIPGLSEGIMWDFKDDCLATWLFDFMDIDTDFIPKICPSFSDQGRLTKKAADAIGLAEGTPVLYRAGDQPNNALSLNVLNPGEIAATGGTSGVVYAVTDRTETKESIRINNFAHVNHSKEQPRIGKLLNINGAGIQYNWMKQNIANTGETYSEMNQLAASVPVGSDGLRILPFGNGSERMLNNQSLGARISNLNFNLHRREHLFRAALEGIAFSFVYGIDLLKNDGVDLSIIHAGNDNLFRSALFSKTIASLVKAKINIHDTTGAVGAARAAAVSKGAFKNLEEVFSINKEIISYHPSKEHQNYREFYELWKQDLESQYHH